ncbi:MAG TPA: HNH endonuclease signature motif containing protein [Promineifilum sp.]|nr:HNH endonuclease signature motif containing protein [Promineifilum sp.]
MTAPLSAEVRQEVARRAEHRCSYCRSREEIVGAAFTVDHIVPQALGGRDDIDNLCLACWDCNRLKHTHVTGIDSQSGERVALFDPNYQLWTDHFAWDEGGRLIVGLTAAGRATVNRLQLNRPILVRARGQWIRAGWHPADG